MGRPVEKKRKKKGRPSLLDLQKRSLRLQKQQQQQQQQQQQAKRNPNPNSTPNPYTRFHGRSTRRNPEPEGQNDAEDGEEDEEGSEGSSGGGGGGRRREKKLKLVLRLPPGRHSDSSSGSDGGEAGADDPRKRRRVEGDREKTGGQNSGSKATDPPQGDPSDSGPTTPLPDKKLLVFILDRLQKKDTYGVFSEPVDPDDLPDYHDIIKHPMDFGTVRKKLSSGAYKNLEQFEKDVFLICSNAMRYNSADTVYYRQARSIQELARKNFENLRQESDDNEPEPEPKIVRRGRPPSKNTIKRTVGRPPAERTASSEATLANARDGSQWSNSMHDLASKGWAFVKSSAADGSVRASHGPRFTDMYIWNNRDQRSERKEDYSGSALRGVPIKNGKKISVTDENRRSTYKQPTLATCLWEAPVLTSFDGEPKLLVPVGVHMEHAYARSLARFAASLGPLGWEIAAKRIVRALPPGSKFGPGWVGDDEAPKQSQPALLSTCPPESSSQPVISPCATTVSRSEKTLERQEPPLSSDSCAEENHNSTAFLPSTSASAAPTPIRPSSNPVEGAVADRDSNCESRGNLTTNSGREPKMPAQLYHSPAMQPYMNGFNAAFGFSLPSQIRMMGSPATPQGHVGTETLRMSHAQALDMVSRSENNSSFIHREPMNNALKAKSVCNLGSLNSSSLLPNSSHDSQGQWRASSLNPKPGSVVPPDLNVGFQSPGSPVQSVRSEQQHPDLALQL